MIITGLVGIRPADNNEYIVVNPLIPDDAIKSFVLENVYYRGNYITVVYDKYGTVYNTGAGITVYVNGKVSSHSAVLSKLVVSLNVEI